MSTVPFIFADKYGEIPLEELDINFANVKAYANTAGMVLSSAQPYITSVGLLTNLSVAGNVNFGNIVSPNVVANLLTITTITSTDPAVIVDSDLLVNGNVTSSSVVSSTVVTNFIRSDDSSQIIFDSGIEVNGDVNARKLVTNFVGSDDSSQIVFDDGIEINGAVVSRSIVTNTIRSEDSSLVGVEDGLEIYGDLITNGYYYGNGSQLTGIQATEVGNLETLSVVGNAVVGGLSTTGNIEVDGITAVGNVSGNYFIGNGSMLTGVLAPPILYGNLDGNLIGNGFGAKSFAFLSTTGNVVAGNVVISGAVYTNGTVVTGTGSGGNILNANVISANTFTATGNLISAGRIAVLSTAKRTIWVSNVAPINPNGSNGDIWFQY